jgi:type III pantothenate kinase
MINIVVDVGNTRIKVGFFRQKALVEKLLFQGTHELFDYLRQISPADHVIISSVAEDSQKILDSIRVKGKKIVMNAALPLPLKNLYATPSSLGVDRIAGACGAFDLFPGRPVLVIDTGTCVNYEFVDGSGNYHGGAISPGLRMRFEAMHKFTARLPLIEADLNPPLTGIDTTSCMQSGVLNGMIAEIDGFTDKYLKIHADLAVILCGGDYAMFENKLKHLIFVAPDLVLGGLNRILLYNVEN